MGKPPDCMQIRIFTRHQLCLLIPKLTCPDGQMTDTLISDNDHMDVQKCSVTRFPKNLSRWFTHHVVSSACVFLPNQGPLIPAMRIKIAIASTRFVAIYPTDASSVAQTHHPTIHLETNACCAAISNSILNEPLQLETIAGYCKQSVIRMKRQFDDVMAIQFGRLMGNLLEKFDVSNDLDLIVPIPIHWSKRLRRKGFHGSDVIAEGIRHITGIKKNRRVLMSTRATAKQGKLSIRQRFQNINGALAVRRSVRLQDLQILLVDDVMTSGATVSEAAKVMMDAGAAKVFVAVVARGARVS